MERALTVLCTAMLLGACASSVPAPRPAARGDQRPAAPAASAKPVALPAAATGPADSGPPAPPERALPPDLPARGPLDDSCRQALEKVNETIHQDYVQLPFKRRIEILRGIAKSAAKHGCPAWVVARTWMYIGVVEGSGIGDMAAARAAFDKALAIDPRVELDRALVTRQVAQTFAEARRAAQASH